MSPLFPFVGKSRWKRRLPPDIVEKTLPDHYMYHSPIQLDVFPTDVQMRRIDPARNMRRFYRLSVQRDLFGRASLVREWGRIGFRGQMMVETTEPPRVYRRVKHSKDEPYDKAQIHPRLSC